MRSRVVLPQPGGTEQGDELALVHLEAHAVERVETAVTLVRVRDGELPHCRPPPMAADRAIGGRHCAIVCRYSGFMSGAL